ncbi:MAG: protein-glutamate O-methyltransferase CheR [Coriobacteriia bacterium]|nr:protein-glutamate O-methyltransferase CheR [Coriobacteriia bacterium]MBN2840670.1 protein-glutamate O-methyltransferase CheR [Coriobacteriia bacterium]
MQPEPGEGVPRGNLDKLLRKVMAERGLDLQQYRERYVERRLAVRLNTLGIQTYAQYAAYLDRDPDEYHNLVDAITINVTQFFRDAEVFELFRCQVVPAIIEQKVARRQRVLRVWSAGCATGEEPYSLAMSLLDQISRLGVDTIVPTVIGTDLDRLAIATAKRAVYPVRQLEQIPKQDRLRYLDIGAETFTVKQRVRDMVRFQYLNLFEDPPIHGVDAVFCRNVFIYFNKADQERLVRAFWESLIRGGYLVLGRSERLTPEVAGDFELVDGRQRIYRKPLALQRR